MIRAMYIMTRSPWPLVDGQSVMAHHVIEAMVNRGHEVHVMVASRGDGNESLASWPLRERVTVHEPCDAEAGARRKPGLMSYVRGRWARYWGWSKQTIRGVAAAAERVAPDYVEGIGLDVLPLMRDVSSRVPGAWVTWLAGDEWCLHHLTQLGEAKGWRGRAAVLRRAAAMACYERSYRGVIDAAIAVSRLDAKALRWFGGFHETAVSPNGVDARYWRPGASPQTQQASAVFWGRLDFSPNVEGLRWFCERVWPRLRQHEGRAVCYVVGRNPTAEVERLAQTTAGVKLIGPVDDVRPWARRGAVTVLPLRSGGGIKNKLLEAAALGRPIVATRAAVRGLEFAAERPWVEANGAEHFAEAVRGLWANHAAAERLGETARQWVTERYDWGRAARVREELIAQMNAAEEQHTVGRSPAIDDEVLSISAADAAVEWKGRRAA